MWRRPRNAWRPERGGDTSFLWMDRQPAAARLDAERRLRAGEVLIERLETRDADGDDIEIPKGMVHHWVGTVIIPGVTLDETMAMVQDYERYAEIYTPNVRRSALLGREGHRYRSSLQLYMKKVVSVVLNTEYDVAFQLLDDRRAWVPSYACAGKARSRGTRCRDVIFETLFETLWVSNPIRPRSAASRNRVMRGPGVTQGAKRSQGPVGRVIEPRNALSAGADVVRWTEGHLAASQRPWRRRPRRGRSAWHACGWVSREPGRPRRLHRKDRRGAGTGSPSPRPWTQHLASDGAKPQVLGWYRRAKATKRGGMDGEESECLIVPPKRGN